VIMVNLDGEVYFYFNDVFSKKAFSKGLRTLAVRFNQVFYSIIKHWQLENVFYSMP